MSQGRLAECVNKSQAHISGIESERDNPSIELLEKIAQALDCQLYIDLIPNGAPVTPSETVPNEIIYEEERQTAPTWFTIEQASAATIFTIALEKLKLEKETLTIAERKTLEGLIETCREVMEK